jgi:uncharacterized damage-inducible protein DinB
MRELLADMLRQMEWADALVWRAVLGHPPAAEDAKIRELLYHIAAVQHAYLAVWNQEPMAMPQPGDFADAIALRDWARAGHGPSVAFITGADDAAIAGPFDAPWAAQIAELLGRPPGTASIAESVSQVTSHSAYHRGQINARLRTHGANPPLVDFIAWIWTGKPAPEW